MKWPSVEQVCPTYDVHGYYQIISQEQDITLEERVRRFEEDVRIHQYMKDMWPIAGAEETGSQHPNQM